ncbi:MAG: metallophosphoesterase [Candidatus Peregrinibacteria bacterium]|nr:metallophosphoesterase [Candidatus Peregrinibacteria bacterium]
MVNKILKLYASKGFFLNKETLELLSSLSEENIQEIAEILSGLGIKERIITLKIFDKYRDRFNNFLPNKDKNIKKEGINLLSGLNFPSKKIEVGDFVKHFRVRYESIKNIFINEEFNKSSDKKNLQLGNLSSIRKIGTNRGVYTIIAAVSEKRITKNKNLLLEVEDLTGKSVVLVNSENSKLFAEAKNLLLDDIVAFRVSGSSEMLFANEIIYPDAGLKEEKYSDFDEYVAFSGDFHVGSKMFLEKNVLKFVSWLNGEIGDERQRAIAKKVKYLFLTGDNIDGVSHYPGQENFLNIKACRGQYLKVEEILRKIRRDVQIIMCPGQHDSVWIGEPQPAISEKWAPGLYQMENLHLVPNPSLVEINGGFKILMYHGASINRFIDELSEIRIKFGHSSPVKSVKEMLKRRHLAPVHGLMDYIPCEDKDPLVIDIIPDIITTADQHRAEIDSYNNILIVASSCWQSITPFEEKVGNIPDPCKVPLFNLKTREIKIMDFSEEPKEICWETGDNLVCKLGDKKNV